MPKGFSKRRKNEGNILASWLKCKLVQRRSPRAGSLIGTRAHKSHRLPFLKHLRVVVTNLTWESLARSESRATYPHIGSSSSKCLGD